MINYIYKLVWNEQNQMLFEITNGKTVQITLKRNASSATAERLFHF